MSVDGSDWPDCCCSWLPSSTAPSESSPDSISGASGSTSIPVVDLSVSVICSSVTSFEPPSAAPAPAAAAARREANLLSCAGTSRIMPRKWLHLTIKSATTDGACGSKVALKADAARLHACADGAARSHADVGPWAPLHRGCEEATRPAASAKGVEARIGGGIVGLSRATKQSGYRREEHARVEGRCGRGSMQTPAAKCLGREYATERGRILRAKQTIGEHTGCMPDASEARRALCRHCAKHACRVDQLSCIALDNAEVRRDLDHLLRIRGRDLASASRKDHGGSAILAQPLAGEQAQTARAAREQVCATRPGVHRDGNAHDYLARVGTSLEAAECLEHGLLHVECLQGQAVQHARLGARG
eukprot:scaffold36275_cov154-Isochrysis_galbana.AAC.34